MACTWIVYDTLALYIWSSKSRLPVSELCMGVSAYRYENKHFNFLSRHVQDCIVWSQPSPYAEFFTVFDPYRCLKPSQATSRRSLAANPTECTLSCYNTDSVVSSACTIPTDGGANLTHVQSSSTVVDGVDLWMDMCLWYVEQSNFFLKKNYILFFFQRNGHYNYVRVQYPRSHLCSQISTCTVASNNLSCQCKIKPRTNTQTAFQGFITQRSLSLSLYLFASLTIFADHFFFLQSSPQPQKSFTFSPSSSLTSASISFSPSSTAPPYPQSPISTPSRVVHYSVPPSPLSKTMGSSTSTAEYLTSPSPVSAYRGRLTADVGRAFFSLSLSLSSLGFKIWLFFFLLLLVFAWLGALDGSYLTRLMSDDTSFDDWNWTC